MYNSRMRVVLASNSPRRKELLAEILPEFEIIPSFAPEISNAVLPEEVVVELAEHKARDVWNFNREALVIGCDTVVDLDGKVLGKPANAADACRMLNGLSGKTHFVHTGVCVIFGEDKRVFCETTSVTFRNLTQKEILDYVSGGAPMDKAGAYGIQECGFVSEFSGSYNNVVGLPTERLKKVLQNYKR